MNGACLHILLNLDTLMILCVFYEPRFYIFDRV